MLKERKTNQFKVLISRRFAPFFATQFLGAFNDNIYKNALVLIIAYQTQVNSLDSSVFSTPDILINVAAGLFILPFFLFSALAGQIADKYEKAKLIEIIKLAEVAIMAFGLVAFYLNNILMLIFLLFLLGIQATFFGPVKYSIIPYHLHYSELTGGNALVEMGTFIAILIGTLIGGFLVKYPNGKILIGLLVLLIAMMGYLASKFIPKTPSVNTNIKINFNLFSQTLENIKFSTNTKSVFLSILAISWFWLLGACYLTQIPNFTKLVLKGDESVVTLLLAVFSIGIGIGSLLCEKLSGHKVELGLVPLGSIGLSLFGFDLFLAYKTPDINYLMGIQEFINASSNGSLRVLIDLGLIGIFGGFYIVPLFAFVQLRTKQEFMSRIIAANNIMNALFMVFSTMLGVVLLGIIKLTISQFFLIIAVLNTFVAIYIYTVVPEFLMRFLIWMLIHSVYRVNHKNLENIPEEGPAVLVCNHVSYVDGLIIAGSYQRPIRFVVDWKIYKLPILNFIFRTGKAIPITSEKQNPEVYNKAFEEISKTLQEGELICIFPEGRLTRDGNIDKFRPGIEMIIERNPVCIVPLALKGLWGSFFSNKYGKGFLKMPRRFWSKVEILAGSKIDPKINIQDAKAENLRKIVSDLFYENFYEKR